MSKLDSRKVAITTGLLFLLMHAVAVILLQFGLMNYWQWAHMATFDHAVTTFNILQFIVGSLVAGLAGSILGLLFSLIYNKL